MASPCGDISRTKSMKTGERCCFVCKKSILLYKYTNLSTTSKGGIDSQKKNDIIRRLQIILDCDDETSRAWKYICEPCSSKANTIFEYCEDKNAEVSDDVAERIHNFVTMYETAGVLRTRTPNGKRNRTPSSTPSPTGKRPSSSQQLSQNGAAVGTSRRTLTPRGLQTNKGESGAMKRSISARNISQASKENKSASMKKSASTKNISQISKESKITKTPSVLQTTRKGDTNVNQSKKAFQKGNTLSVGVGMVDSSKEEPLHAENAKNTRNAKSPSNSDEQKTPNEDILESSKDYLLPQTAVESAGKENTCQMQPHLKDAQPKDIKTVPVESSTTESVARVPPQDSTGVQCSGDSGDLKDLSQINPFDAVDGPDDFEVDSELPQEANINEDILPSSNNDNEPQNTVESSDLTATSDINAMKQFENIDEKNENPEDSLSLSKKKSTNQDVLEPSPDDTQLEVTATHTADLEVGAHLQPIAQVDNSKDQDAPSVFPQQTYTNEDISAASQDGTHVHDKFDPEILENASPIQPVKHEDETDSEQNSALVNEQTNTNEDVLASSQDGTELRYADEPSHMDRRLHMLSQMEPLGKNEGCEDYHEGEMTVKSDEISNNEDVFQPFQDSTSGKDTTRSSNQRRHLEKMCQIQQPAKVEKQNIRSVQIETQEPCPSTNGDVSVTRQDDTDRPDTSYTTDAQNVYQMQPLVKIEGADSMTLDEIKELQLVMNIKEAAFREESRAKKGKVSERQLQAIIGQHKKQKEECERLRNIEKMRMNEKLQEKLAARRKSRKSSPIVNTERTSEAKEQTDVANSQNLDEKLECRKTHTKEEQMKRQFLSSEGDIQQLTSSHERGVNELQQKMDLQKKNQSKDLLDKLAARRVKRGKKEESKTLSADEVKELQSALDQKSVDFRKHMEQVRKTMSSEEVQKLLDAHLSEVDLMQQQLNKEKERMQAVLIAKLKARRQGQSNQITDIEPMSEEDVKQLQLLIDQKDSAFKEELKSTNGEISDSQCKKITDRHNREMSELQEMLDREKLRMQQKLNDKLTARTSKPRSDVAKKREVDSDVEAIEREIKSKIATFSQEAQELRPLLSDEEYDQLLAHHRKELKHLKDRLNEAMKIQKQHDMAAKDESEDRAFDLLQKFINPEKFKDSDFEPLTEEEFDELDEYIKHYDNAALSHILSQKGKVSEAEFAQLIQEHQRNMKACYGKLERQRRFIWTSMAVSDSEESEDEDIANPVAISASTQLWTTPTQLAVLAMVPLIEEYPIRKRKQLYTNPSKFKHLDAHAIKMAQTGVLVSQPSFSALLNELIQIATTELEKVRLIFRWITAQNCEYMDIADAVDDTPLGVLKGLYQAKITFATLFMRMCRFVGLRCVEISGCAKLKGYQPGISVSLEDSAYAHTWNAVRIDGYWHFIDCNWGVSYIPGSVSFDPFRFEYDEHYFLTDPDVMIKTHFPNNASWQLLRQPITLEQFNEMVLLKPYFFKFGFELLSHQNNVIDTHDGDLDIQIGCPLGFLLYCKILTVVGDREISSRGVCFSQYVSIHQVAEKVMTCHVRFPEPGHYYATFYAKQQFVDGTINFESQTEICKYYVKSYAPSSDTDPLPPSPADHWGPLGVENAGLIPISHECAVIKCQDGSDIDIRFKKKHPDLKFTHDMTGNGLHEMQLAPYSIQRDVGDEIIFTVSVPEVGRYGLHIYAIYPEHAHLCSYLIEMSNVVPLVQPIPALLTGEEYGPSIAFHDLGITSFTHSDPFIRTSARDLQIVFGLSETKVTLEQTLTYHQSGDGREDLSSIVDYHFESGIGGNSVTYYLYLDKTGYYHFRLVGKKRDAPSKNQHMLLFNYLIRKD